MSSVHIEVANLLEQVPQVEVHAQWLDQPKDLRLTDDGSLPWDIAHDQVYCGELQGDPVRMLPLRIDVGLDGATPVERWTSVEAVEPGEDELVYELSYADGGPRIQRVAAPWFGQARPDHEHTRVLVLGTWTLLLYGVVALQVLRWRN